MPVVITGRKELAMTNFTSISTRTLTSAEVKKLGLPVASAKAIKTLPIFEIDLDCFIVPNKLGKVSDLALAKPNSDLLQQVGKLNHWTISEDDELVELWFVSRSQDLVSDNCHDHGINHYDEYISFPVWCLPKSFVRDQKEGNFLQLKLPAYINKRAEGLGAQRECVLRANIRFAQKDYRYRTFGNFEEVLAQV